VRLLAGPGTGKTLTLTRHLLKLIQEDQIPPEAVVAFAFTRVNAFDLNREVSKEFGQHGIAAPRISTLHSFALLQLMRNARLVQALPQPVRIADDYEERWIIRADLASILGLSDRDVRDKLAQLSSDWQDLRFDEQPYLPADPAFMAAWLRHRETYGYSLRSELVWQLKHAMEEHPDEFEMGAKIGHLLVDEYQDLNQCDLAVVAAIAQMGAVVYCAGDDDQSIYSFRGAYPEGIRRFPQDFAPSAALDLEVCFRSDRRIIALGQYVASLDVKRLPKPIAPRPEAAEGEVHLLNFSDQHQEAQGVALIASHLVRSRGCPPSQILLLLRSDHQSRYSTPLCEELQAVGIPAKVRAERGGPLDEIDGRHLLSLLRIAVNPRDDLAWRTLLHLVRRGNGIGDSTISCTYERALERRGRFSSVLELIEASPSEFVRGAHVAADMAEIRQLVAPFSNLPIPETARIDDPAYREALSSQLMTQVATVARSVIADKAAREAVMIEIARAAVSSGCMTIEELVRALTSPEDTLDQELEEGCVNILTMHRAKGLSAEAVIIVGAEEELIPGAAAGEAYEDERRLLYVSLTRAKHFLAATFCSGRTGRQRHSGSNPGNPHRHLTPFLRGAIGVERGLEFAGSLEQTVAAEQLGTTVRVVEARGP
jgi:DNA helicase-2/ATP-dependent DNA helicase PcrA